ncbi:hypothetical protein D3C76_1873180 [compost metagenome]
MLGAQLDVFGSGQGTGDVRRPVAELDQETVFVQLDGARADGQYIHNQLLTLSWWIDSSTKAG